MGLFSGPSPPPAPPPLPPAAMPPTMADPNVAMTGINPRAKAAAASGMMNMGTGADSLSAPATAQTTLLGK